MTSTGRPEPTVAALCEAIWDTERELALLDWRIGDVHVWPVVRMRVLHELSRRCGLHDEAHPVRRTPSDKARLVARHAAGLVRRNPFLLRRRFDAAVVPHHRKVGDVEVYSEWLRAELGDRALVLDSNINGVALAGSYTLDFFTSYAGVRGRLLQRSGAGRRLVAGRGPGLDGDRVAAVVDALEKRTGARIDLAGLVVRELTKHRTLRSLYRSVLRRRGVRTLYVVVAYFHQHVVGAARDLGIPVVELQHGAVTPYHLGYSYPGRPDVPGQPDELWCFGSYWAETVDLPREMRTRVIGAPFLRRPDPAVAKDPNLVLFASQGTVGRRLLPFAVGLADRRPDLRVEFRLHPSEHAADYRDRIEGAPANLRLSGGRGGATTETTYDLLSAATFVVGVSTTALFEGMALGCRAVVADLPGAEYLDPAVERGDAIRVRDPGELARRLDDAPLCHRADAYYAPPVSPLLTS